MKRKLLFSSKAKRWNLLLRKFKNLYHRIKTNKLTPVNLQGLINKLLSIYRRLEKMQYKVGIKLAGTAIALMMISASGVTQDFSSIGYLTSDNSESFGDLTKQTFADIDNDGDLDLYVGYSDGSIKVFTNNGVGNFSAAGNLQADGSDINLEHDAAPIFADIDNDSDLDLYIGVGWNGKIKVFINDGDGNFTDDGFLQADGIDIDLYGPHNIYPTFADIDNDSDLDLYIGGHIENMQDRIFIYTNDGDGTFSSNGYLQADGSYIVIDGGVPAFADIDNDNDLDLYVGSYGLIEVFTNDGTGNFSATGNFQVNGVDIEGGVPEFVDLDSDSDLDLYVGDYYGYIQVFINDGNGSFSSFGNLQVSGADIDVGLLSTPVFGDIDSDSDLDLVVGEYDGTLKLFTNDGYGNFTSFGNLQANGSDIDIGYWSNPEFNDIDTDGDFDLFVGTSDGFIKVFTNNGSGVFSDAGNLQADGFDINVGDYGSAAPVFADLDEDSDLDLFVGDSYGKINIFINDGNGDFSAAGYMQADGSDINVEYEAAPEFADIDGDNDLDLYVGNADGFIKVFMNEGNENFSAADNLQADGSDIEHEYKAVPVFEDIDNDSDLDLYVGDYYGKISVYINGGPININEIANSLELLVYPNPSSNIFNLEIPTSFGSDEVLVTNLSGKIIQKLNVNSSINFDAVNKQIVIDLSSQSKGIYLINLKTDSGIITEKLIVE